MSPSKDSDCGHRCCEIRANPCHVHACGAHRCDRCAAADDEAWGEGGAEEVPRITAAVLRAVAPRIRHLPAGDDLDELVHAVTLTTWRDSMDDPRFRGLPRDDRRRVVAARVGLVLAFPS